MKILSRFIKVGLALAVLLAGYFAFAAITPAQLEAQQRLASQTTLERNSAAPDTVGAAAAGAAASSHKGVMSTYFVSGTTSILVPATGLAYLLFLHSGEVEPNFAEQTFLRDKSPEYVEAWSQGYDRALTKRHKKAIFIGTAVGTAVGVALIWGPLINALSSY